jgi:hypothetical protein
MKIDNNYKVIAYSATLESSNEMYEFRTDSVNWFEARKKAIEQALLWKNSSDKKDNYLGIKVELVLTNLIEKTNVKIFTILSGNRMHSPEITKVLWEEAELMNTMGYSYDITILEDQNGQQRPVLSDYYIALYYFTT